MRIFKLVVCFLVLMVLFSTQALAQTCPNGKTAFLLVNGVTTNQDEWGASVNRIKASFFASHPALNASDPNCVVFDAVWNNSHQLRDFFQATGNWSEQELAAIAAGIDSILAWAGLPSKLLSALESFKSVLDLTDPDLSNLVNAIGNRSANGYRVVLVGHSQGTFYTNRAYEMIRDRNVGVPNIHDLPNPNMLSIVNIASATDRVSDGRNMYVTECTDIIQNVPFSLPWNVNNSDAACPVVFASWVAHDLEKSYFRDGSRTKARIYQYLEDSLPDPGCGNDPNCFLKDNFSSSDYTKNYTIKGGTAFSVSVADATLIMTSGSDDQSSLRTRRILSGLFTARLEYNIFGSDKIFVGLVDVLTDKVMLATNDINGRKLSFIKDDAGVTMYLDGIFLKNISSAKTAGYYLVFVSQGVGRLKIQNLTVVRDESISPPPPPPAVPTISSISVVGAPVAQTAFDMQVTGTNIVVGQVQAWVFDTDVCANGCQHPPNGIVSPTTTGFTLHDIRLNSGSHYLRLRNTSTGAWSNNSAAFTVAALPASMTFTPATNTLTVAQGNSGTVNLVLTSQNGLTGNASLLLYCYQSACPAGITYNYTYPSVSLPSNGSVAATVTFYTTTITPGTYNYMYSATLGGLTKSAMITLIVTAPTSSTPTLIFTPTTQSKSVVAGQSVSFDATLQATNTAAGSANFTMYCSQACPAGFSYNYTYGQMSIAANGSLAAHATFTVSASAVPGTYNFEHWATLNGLNAITRMAVTVTAPVANPTPVINSYSVSTTPRAGKPFDLTLNGSGFVSAPQGYVCNGTTSSSTCFAVVTLFFNSGQVALPAINWQGTGTIYVKVVNPNGTTSNFVSLTVNP